MYRSRAITFAKHYFTSISLALYFCFIGSPTSTAQEVPFSTEVYNDWIEMRIGDGIDPVYWTSYGEVYSFPEDVLLARMTGVDMSLKVQITQDSILQTSRKIYIYTDPETGKKLDEYNGNPVKHIQYPYQLIAYVRDNDMLRTWVTQGTGDNIRVIGPGTDIRARKLGKSMFYTAPLILNFDTPRGKYQAAENYDFFYNPEGKTTQDKYQISWTRFGAAPSFAGASKAFTHMVSYRVDTFEELDPELKKYIRKNAPLWLKPPMSLQEIEELQKAQ